jgi:hypothetical protein
MTRSIPVFLSLPAIAFLLFACSDSFHSASWKANNIDFKKYKTYAWVSPGDTTISMRRDDKLFAGTIFLYSNEELRKKGMTMVKQRPDVVFMFDTQVDDRTRYTQSPTLSMGVGYGGPGYYVGGSAPIAGGQITAVPYQEGRLIIEMFDTQTRKLVWRGWAEKSIEGSSDVSNLIKWGVRDIFYKLPVKVKS